MLCRAGMLKVAVQLTVGRLLSFSYILRSASWCMNKAS